MQSTPYLLPPPPRRVRSRSLQIEISGIPAENGKCRVETQLKVGFQLRGKHGETVMDWKQIRLPRMLIAKEKHRIEKFNGRDKQLQDSEILILDARLVCDHDKSKVLECCDNCIGRERKRAHRRKETLKLPGPLGSIPVFGAIHPKSAGASLIDESNPPTPTDPLEYQAWERSRIMVFSSTEYVDISAGECVLPTRITCYCRHHNEKVGFRIQFTARDSTGAVVASVLTNPVMMMDDHKSGKRAVPIDARGAVARHSVSGPSPAAPRLTVKSRSGQQQVNQYLQPEEDQADAELDGNLQEDQDELDLETGRHVQPIHGMNGLKSEDDELPARMVGKRRVDDDDHSMEDIQIQQQSFRRKTCHDLSQSFTSSTFPFAAFSRDSSLSLSSPFMPGSPFANEEDQNGFVPLFGQSVLHNENMPHRHQHHLCGDMFSIAQRNGSIQSVDVSEHERFHSESAASMMEYFTTLEESMSSPPSGDTHASSMLTGRPSFSIPATIHPTSPGMYTPISPFSPNHPPTDFSSEPTATTTIPASLGLNSSFLDTTQIQEFQTFQRHSVGHSQQLFMQFQQGIQQQRPGVDTTAGPWTPPPSAVDIRDFHELKAGLTQNSHPSSSAFIQIPASLPDNIESECSDTAMSSITDEGDGTFASGPKKRGRPRKSMTVMPNAAPASGASSPMTSPKVPSTNMPPSPSPPPSNLGYPSTATTPKLSDANAITPFTSNAGSSTAAAAAQILLYQQQQLQIHQQQQQQLQQQQKQAILTSRPLQQSKPRVKKLVPAKGSIEGGMEVTLLGTGFFPGMVPTFGGVPAAGVQFYGPETIICRLPPRPHPGVVIVKAQHQSQPLSASAAAVGARSDDPLSLPSHELVRTMAQFLNGSGSVASDDEDVGVLFEYEEDKGDRDLIALALQVLGMKMNGRVEPPHQVAMRIMATAAAQQQQLVEQQQQQQQLQNAIMAASISASGADVFESASGASHECLSVDLVNADPVAVATVAAVISDIGR
ncbi:hypothetical protein BC939DRAFT_480571 [Gamsiella multidivaricata]|uniref:uncharacterized protein n=1 Tax=Gamsiella multidivaricata TaxID=101098 RepID=UPI00222083F4|nr:uncharacterized protein BC939DRAFT_480571 [Gamsiella multidivaricata]KAI7818125.1 hypothetical protein BC939DRAFT_480571 [Gamsiella multidivaricata]